MLNRMNIRFFIVSSLLLIGLSFIAYFNTLNSFFTADDFGMVSFGEYARLWDALKLFVPCSLDIFIRPLTLITWLIDYRLWGLNPVGYRVVNLMMHSISSISVLLIAYFLLRNKTVALGAGLLFALHPVHSGVVSYITHRSDLMCVLFYLLSLAAFAFYAYYKRRWLFYLISIICYPLALFSKEMAITLPLAVILYDSFVTRSFSLKPFLSRVKLYVPYIAITLLYIVWRTVWIGNIGGDIDPATGRSEFFNFHLLDFIKKSLYSIPAQFFVPLNQSLFSHNSIQLITMVFGLGVIIAALLSWKELLKNIHPVLFGILWIVALLVPVHFLTRDDIMESGSRYVYLPSVGFCIALAFILLGDKRGRINKYISLTIFSIFCIIYIFIGARNNSAWIYAGEINRSIPRIVNDYYKNHGRDIKLYFLIPNITNEGVEVFADETSEVLSLLFRPIDSRSVVILRDDNLWLDPVYLWYDFDLRQQDILGNLGKNVFFFRYNEDKDRFEDLSLPVKANLLEYFASSKVSTALPSIELSRSTESTYISQPLNIPAYFLGAVEVKMRFKVKSCQDVGTITWYRNDNQESLSRSFLVERDNEFHTYRVPFTIFKPDWTRDTNITKIELLPSGSASGVDIEYVKLLPYEK